MADTDNRNFNGFEFGFQLERTQAGPIDATQLVYGSANLISETTWKNNSGVYTFPGMLVSTVDNKTNKNYTGTYVLTKSEYQTKENWDKLITKSDIGPLEYKNNKIQEQFSVILNNFDNSLINLQCSNASLQIYNTGITLTSSFSYGSDIDIFRIANYNGSGIDTFINISGTTVKPTISGTLIVTANTTDESLYDDLLVSVGYLNKKLEEFTPKVQSQLKMYVYDIDENNDTTETTDVANIQIVRETNGVLTFEVENTITSEAEVLAGNSNTTINKTLQLNINDKKSDGTITPTTEVASVMVVRNVSGKMSIKIS